MARTASSRFKPQISLNLKGKLYPLDERPLVMGIINLTPDSFYSASRVVQSQQALLQKAEQLLQEGADILDLGGYSTRPSADDIPLEEEWRRLAPALQALAKHYPEVPVSVDSFRAEIARRAAAEGAAILNDVSGGTLDEQMFPTVAELGLPYILMHMRGTPKTMTKLTDYKDVSLDVLEDLRRKAKVLRQQGFGGDIILDPGFGFSKDRQQNYELMQRLSYFHALEMPLLVGISRKSMIWGLLGSSAEESLNGTTVLNTIALLNGAHILRVHDVKEAVEAVKIVMAVKGAEDL